MPPFTPVVKGTLETWVEVPALSGTKKSWGIAEPSFLATRATSPAIVTGSAPCIG